MSKTAVIVALLIAICLGAAALWLTGGRAPVVPSGPLLTLDPSTVSEVKLTMPDGSSQAVVRDASEWRVVLTAADKSSRSWPAAQQQVFAALRIFAELKPDREGSGSLTKIAGTLSIASGAGVQTLRISDQRLAGSVLVESRSGPVWVDANVSEMLVATGIKAWRDIAAIPGVSTDIARIAISSDTGASLSLARVQGKWYVREPIAEAADPEGVARLVSILGAARVREFCDAGVPAQANFDKPVATLAVETDTRDSGGKAATIRQSITVGPAADVGNRSVYAKLERSGAGAGDYSEVCIVDREQLAAIPTDPTLLISRQAVRVEAADVGQVSIAAANGECKERSYRRTVEGWDVRCGGSEWTGIRVDDAKSLRSLLELLTAKAPDKVMLRKDQPALAPVASIQLQTAGGGPISAVTIGVEGTKLLIDTDHVRRLYTDSAAVELAAWLGQK